MDCADPSVFSVTIARCFSGILGTITEKSLTLYATEVPTRIFAVQGQSSIEYRLALHDVGAIQEAVLLASYTSLSLSLSLS